MHETPEFAALSDEKRQALLHVQRYWVTTEKVYWRWLRPEVTADAVRKMFSRMVEDQWLVRHLLRDQEHYYMLGPKGNTAFELRRTLGPLGSQALLEHYAVLLACHKRDCDIFTEIEFRETFPELNQPGWTAKNYFPDRSRTPTRIGWFIVDHDKQTRRLVNKLGRCVAKLIDCDREKLRKRVHNGDLAFHVLTATEGKRANLIAALKRKPPERVLVIVDCFPDDLGDFFLVNRR